MDMEIEINLVGDDLGIYIASEIHSRNCFYFTAIVLPF
jgi:hypothetical protein